MGTFVAPKQAIQNGIARTALPYGLFSVLGFREDGERWLNGIEWETDTCAPIGAIEQWYCAAAAVNEVQTLTIGGAGLTSFTITYAGQTTGAIAEAATAPQIQTALEALSNIGVGDVAVSRNGNVITVTFTGALGGTDVAQFTATPTGGTGTVTPATVTQGVPAEAAPTGLPKDLTKDETPYGEANPFSVYGHYNCSLIGRNGNLEHGREKAREHLRGREQQRVEQALWTGDLNNVPNFSGANGYAAPVNVGSFNVNDSEDALAKVEQELAVRYGSVGVIHMSREIALGLIGKMAVDSRQGRLFTKLGTPVVAGTGYPSDRIVGSAAMIGYRSEIFEPSDRPYDLLNRGNNDLIAVAERTYVVGFDPCGLVAATLTTVE